MHHTHTHNLHYHTPMHHTHTHTHLHYHTHMHHTHTHTYTTTHPCTIHTHTHANSSTFTPPRPLPVFPSVLTHQWRSPPSTASPAPARPSTPQSDPAPPQNQMHCPPPTANTASLQLRQRTVPTRRNSNKKVCHLVQQNTPCCVPSKSLLSSAYYNICPLCRQLVSSFATVHQHT